VPWLLSLPSRPGSVDYSSCCLRRRVWRRLEESTLSSTDTASPDTSPACTHPETNSHGPGCQRGVRHEMRREVKQESGFAGRRKKANKRLDSVRFSKTGEVCGLNATVTAREPVSVGAVSSASLLGRSPYSHSESSAVGTRHQLAELRTRHQHIGRWRHIINKHGGEDMSANDSMGHVTNGWTVQIWPGGGGGCCPERSPSASPAAQHHHQQSTPNSEHCMQRQSAI